ncbi:ATP-binding protein [Streptoalloteichus hindustanus]|uniref:ATPase family associated with various cellular activities (AAA) n=1 Tax=Streptoalloteichus hindustanus TaxID=2017 RepID=A0A1M5CG72_STRHI|nr:ATP-binding protein [Streptoalloteichus hindustanus]SHF53691.1 ATPase family associated with various cellular activities (AAA) [Streptoalloteichus hindustanus]
MSELGYPDSQTHLRDELARVEHLLRAAVPTRTDEPDPDGPDERPRHPDPALDHRDAARDLAKHIAERVAATGIPLRLSALTRWFGLEEHERDIVLLCLLAEVDADARHLLGCLVGQEAAGPTAAAALLALAPEIAGTPRVWELFSAGRPLLRDHLVVLDPSGEIRVDPVVARHLLGNEVVPDEVAGVLTLAEPDRDPDELVFDPELRGTLTRLAPWLATSERTVILLHGPYGSGRRTVASVLCDEGGQPLLFADVRAALARDWPQVISFCYREARLRGAALCWVGVDPLLTPERTHHWSTLLSAADRFPGTSLLTSEHAWDPTDSFADGRFLRIELPAPTFPQRRALWHALLPAGEQLTHDGGRDEVVHRLATAFRLTAGQIRDAVGAARGVARLRDPANPGLRAGDLFEGCRRQCGHRLVAHARRIAPRTDLTFDDLVLPAPSRRQLTELSHRISLRGRVFGEVGFDRRIGLGRGVTALFTGGSGTGKTMAAELLARAEGVDLYKVDIAAVASKWVGETEKHLDQVFADAERANAMLFFDEADALFAKRGEVKEARDRWANAEMSFLLQRVEEFEGVVLLASNLRQNIDRAFLRRLHSVIDFPAPDAASRLRIWRGMVPPGLSYPDEDELAVLADRFPLTGGNIRNVVLDAAFRALGADRAATAVSVRDLVVSVGREYQKVGLPITPGEFGQPFYAWVEETLLAHHHEGPSSRALTDEYWLTSTDSQALTDEH